MMLVIPYNKCQIHWTSCKQRLVFIFSVTHQSRVKNWKRKKNEWIPILLKYWQRLFKITLNPTLFTSKLSILQSSPLSSSPRPLKAGCSRFQNAATTCSSVRECEIIGWTVSDVTDVHPWATAWETTNMEPHIKKQLLLTARGQKHWDQYLILTTFHCILHFIHSIFR